MMESFIISKFGSDFIKSGNEMLYHCPFCPSYGKRNDDRKLYVNSITGQYNCFRCETSGSIVGRDARLARLLSDNSNLKSMSDELLEFLGCGDSYSEDVYYQIPSYKVVNYPDTIPYNYLISRGITPDLMDLYSIRAFGSGKSFSNRVVIPNLVVQNNWTDFYTSRAILDTMRPRYYNLKFSNKKNIVFNIQNIKKYQDEIIVNEGCINSIIAGTNSVAVLGKHASDSQINQISYKNPRVIYISLDFDARKQALDLALKFHKKLPNSEIKLVDLPDGEDAASLGKDRYLDILSKSKTLYYASSINSLGNLFESFLN